VPAPLPYDRLPKVPSFPVTSDDMADGRMLDDLHVNSDFGLPGSDVSPHLSWSGHPPEARSFAVTCHDPDIPTGSGFWHWVLFDIPSDVTELPRGAATVGAVSVPPDARHVRNDAGTFGYLGPAPDKGDDPHRYVFAVHALDCARLGVDETVSPAVVGYHLSHHVLARGLIVPVWGH
jgi:Raf kinase inhibitor-like YbhB/YbcL family protein